MKEGLARTLVVLACGFVMALAALAGQAGSEPQPIVVSVSSPVTVPPGY